MEKYNITKVKVMSNGQELEPVTIEKLEDKKPKGFDISVFDDSDTYEMLLDKAWYKESFQVIIRDRVSSKIQVFGYYKISEMLVGTKKKEKPYTVFYLEPAQKRITEHSQAGLDIVQ